MKVCNNLFDRRAKQYETEFNLKYGYDKTVNTHLRFPGNKLEQNTT